ncbi:hypothetical protein D1007_10119 [Hordeum vulgare]|nr:hypothetical protein D1007_10119 [Hordeum vulgare]
MALTMNKKTTPMCLAALLLVMSTALLSCHATGRGIGVDDWYKFCVAKPSCEKGEPWAITNCKTDCQFLGYDEKKGYCMPDDGGICCCLK